jgi:hypothetical protein
MRLFMALHMSHIVTQIVIKCTLYTIQSHFIHTHKLLQQYNIHIILYSKYTTYEKYFYLSSLHPTCSGNPSCINIKYHRTLLPKELIETALTDAVLWRLDATDSVCSESTGDGITSSETADC